MWLSFWVVGMVLFSNPYIFKLYKEPFKNPMGYRLASAISLSQESDQKVVLLLGASTVREGFDTSIMNGSQSNYFVINGGTSGGTILTLPAMVEMVKMSGIHPECIVLGINARMLINRTSKVHDHGYTDFLHLMSSLNLSFLRGMEEAEKTQTYSHIFKNTIWPYLLPARRLNQLSRFALFKINNQFYFDNPNSLEQYMRNKNELLPSPEFIYYDNTRFSSEKLKSYEDRYLEEGMFEPTNYATPFHLDLLRTEISRLSKLCNQLIIVEMPEATFSRENFSIHAKTKMEDVINSFSGEVIFIDHSASYSDDQFRDISHMLESTRNKYSQDMVQVLNKNLVNQDGTQGREHD